MTWEPITLDELFMQIHNGESLMNDKQVRLWNLVKKTPKKWLESSYGELGGGFWVVGLIGNNVLWYNDIEHGFNISRWSTFGTIDEYVCNQDTLDVCVFELSDMIENGVPPSRFGPPVPVRFGA